VEEEVDAEPEAIIEELASENDASPEETTTEQESK
jgi:hypothetical protein